MTVPGVVVSGSRLSRALVNVASDKRAGAGTTGAAVAPVALVEFGCVGCAGCGPVVPVAPTATVYGCRQNGQS